jgi:hypothetical protein
VGCDSGSDFNGGIVGVGGIVQWRIVGKDGIIVEVMEVVGVEGSRVLFERYLPLHDTVLKRYRVADTQQATALAREFTRGYKPEIAA